MLVSIRKKMGIYQQWQEPGTNEQIKTFCSTKYHVTFPMYAKVSIKANPSTGGEIGWNFTKFLADRDGKVIGRFGSAVAPESPEMISAVSSSAPVEWRPHPRYRFALRLR
jgi:glutathione peroxidase-family protein